MNVVIVESPAKAKTINKYLGKDYKVLASFGHVRDLPSKDGSVRPDDDFAMDWSVSKDSVKRLNEIASAVKESDKLFLATDPDREGEAISWHVLEVLAKKRALKGIDVKRVVFNEITKSAILNAMAHPRDLDKELVDAYLARRALDYLVGFTLSPVLWRKLPGARSAGRVQSVALRLVCERESEIEQFRPQEYWTVDVDIAAQGQSFKAKLHSLDGKKLEKFTLNTEALAKSAAEKVKPAPHKVTDIEKKPAKRHPSPPFTTSTLQQEAARKLYFNAQRTMRVAQALYEGKSIGGEVTGLITYMRTDGVSMAGEAIAASRALIGKRYGDKYVPEKPRAYKTKQKNAQEAHEAIRPTDPMRSPANVAQYLDDDERKLYELIWKRTIASQMASAQLERTNITISNNHGAILRATGSVVTFDGFLCVYQEGKDDQKDESERLLPHLSSGEAVEVTKVLPTQHFTEPAPRYSEASLVKRLEELGIGRPSTYASILTVLRERNYVRMEKNRFIPEDKGRLVTVFLEKFFTQYVSYDFTANLEEKLDQISAGEENWKRVLNEFWQDFKPKTDEILGVRNAVVIDALDEALAPILFAGEEEGIEQEKRDCPKCEDGKLGLRTSRYGAFVGCSNYPECSYTRPFGKSDDSDAAGNGDGPRVLGQDPETGLDITVQVGRFGPYVQLGEAEKGSKPKRASLPKGYDAATIALDSALALLALPRTVGQHPETGKDITAAIGRYGPYLAHDGAYAKLGSVEEVFTVGLNRAVAAIADAGKSRGASKSVLKELGDHPDDGDPIQLLDGRYGPYVKHKKVNATIPKGQDLETITIEQAVEWLAVKAAKKKPARASKAKTTTKKTTKKATKKTKA